MPLPPPSNMLGPNQGRPPAMPPNNDLRNNRMLGRPESQASDSLRVNHTTGGYQPGAPGFIGAQPSQGDLSRMLGNRPSANPQLRPMDDDGKQQSGSR